MLILRREHPRDPAPQPFRSTGPTAPAAAPREPAPATSTGSVPFARPQTAPARRQNGFARSIAPEVGPGARPIPWPSAAKCALEGRVLPPLGSIAQVGDRQKARGNGQLHPELSVGNGQFLCPAGRPPQQHGHRHATCEPASPSQRPPANSTRHAKPESDLHDAASRLTRRRLSFRGMCLDYGNSWHAMVRGSLLMTGSKGVEWSRTNFGDSKAPGVS